MSAAAQLALRVAVGSSCQLMFLALGQGTGETEASRLLIAVPRCHSQGGVGARARILEQYATSMVSLSRRPEPGSQHVLCCGPVVSLLMSQLPAQIPVPGITF